MGNKELCRMAKIPGGIKLMLKFSQLLENILNAKQSYSVKGSSLSKGDLAWNMTKQKEIIKEIKVRKPVLAYRTFSLSEKEWNKYFENGYTDIGNINVEKGLTSLTLNKKMVGRFAGAGEITIYVEIKMKEYCEILDDSIHPEEKEIIGNNVKWKVTGLNDLHRNWYIIGKQI